MLFTRGLSQYDLAGAGDVLLAGDAAGNSLDLASGLEEGGGLIFDALMRFGSC